MHDNETGYGRHHGVFSRVHHRASYQSDSLGAYFACVPPGAVRLMILIARGRCSSSSTAAEADSSRRRIVADVVCLVETVAAQCQSGNRGHLEYRRQLRSRKEPDSDRRHSLARDSIAARLALEEGGSRWGNTFRCGR